MSLLSRITSFLPRRKVPVPYRPASDISLLVYLDSELGIAFNRREPEVIQYTRNLLEEGFIRTVFDIGANIGSYTFLALSYPDVSVTAFEPHPENVKRLNANSAYNNLSNQLTIVESAVWKSSGTITLQEGTNPRTHSVSAGQARQDEKNVDAVTLDDYCDAENQHPDLVKVDVEGQAGAVVAGATCLLKVDSPDWIVEYHDDDEKQAVLQALTDTYDITPITDNHFHATTRL